MKIAVAGTGYVLSLIHIQMCIRDRGTSVVIINNEKGKQLFDCVKDELRFAARTFDEVSEYKQFKELAYHLKKIDLVKERIFRNEVYYKNMLRQEDLLKIQICLLYTSRCV